MNTWTWGDSAEYCWLSQDNPEILEDGPWSPLYDWEDYVGIAHAVMAMELGLG